MNGAAPRVLTTPVLPVGADEAASLVAAWAAEGAGRAVCAANVHMVMEARNDPEFAELLSGADLTVCDGRPLVWMCRALGVADARQARGLDVMTAATAVAARRGLKVGIYGGDDRLAAEVRRRLTSRFPGLEIVYCWSPPFRALTGAEDEAVVRDIVASGVQILLVSLGCPKQERWMLTHRDRLPCVMLGVGGAFGMLAGDVRVAPRWAQRAGLEWVLRLTSEPRRLWRRYARYNGLFLLLAARQWLGARRRSA